MTDLWADAARRAGEYAATNELVICDQLGAGYDGIVLATTAGSAVKSLRYSELYRRERDVYIRLHNNGVEAIAGCNVPRLIDFDDNLQVVEIEIVQPPFVLDFAGATLDDPPGFPAEVLTAWEAEKREQFGDHWPRVQSVLLAFQRFGIYLADVKPGNIQFE